MDKKLKQMNKTYKSLDTSHCGYYIQMNVLTDWNASITRQIQNQDHLAKAKNKTYRSRPKPRSMKTRPTPILVLKESRFQLPTIIIILIQKKTFHKD